MVAVFRQFAPFSRLSVVCSLVLARATVAESLRGATPQVRVPGRLVALPPSHLSDPKFTKGAEHRNQFWTLPSPGATSPFPCQPSGVRGLGGSGGQIQTPRNRGFQSISSRIGGTPGRGGQFGLQYEDLRPKRRTRTPKIGKRFSPFFRSWSFENVFFSPPSRCFARAEGRPKPTRKSSLQPRLAPGNDPSRASVDPSSLLGRAHFSSRFVVLRGQRKAKNVCRPPVAFLGASPHTGDRNQPVSGDLTRSGKGGS